MALIPKASASPADDAKSINFYEKTGLYDAGTNLGGWEAPNPTIASATGATINVYMPGADLMPVDTPIALNVFGPPLPSSNTLVPYSITNTVLGYAGLRLPDGIYRLRYVISFIGSSTGPVNVFLLFTSNVQCCIDKMFADLDPCNCTCEDSTYMKAVRARNFLIAAEKAACCGNLEAAVANLKMASDICNGDCGCK